jgi:hypothetical protein
MAPFFTVHVFGGTWIRRSRLLPSKIGVIFSIFASDSRDRQQAFFVMALVLVKQFRRGCVFTDSGRE